MKESITAIIVDDEEHARMNLAVILEEICPEVEILGSASSAVEAAELIENQDPELVFLDVMMPGENGFSFLSKIPDRSFSVVFTTAHGEHALKAIKEDAVDYLEKPIDPDDLKVAVS
ncbi:MAG: response regulator, partial [Bacteroidota bacterium]